MPTFVESGQGLRAFLAVVLGECAEGRELVAHVVRRRELMQRQRA